MELDNIIIIVIACVGSFILTSIFFRFLLPIIVFLVIAYFIYEMLTNWNEHRKYQY